tara:strand:- start:733565 stop:734536 length:972 start_codon:yes stop_codon:yes gene_type:complete
MHELDVIKSYVTKDTELQHLFNRYLTDCEYTKRLRPQTIKGYREVFNNFQITVPEITSVDDICPHLVGEFFRRLGTKKRHVGTTTKIGVKPSTTDTYYRKLMAFFNWLENNGYIPEKSISNKIARPPTPTYDDDKALTEEEVSKIISAISLNGITNAFQYKRDIAILSILLYTGIRKGELLGLRVQDVDFHEQTLFIRDMTSKSKRSRIIPVHGILLTQLKTYLKARKNKKSICEALIISTRRDSPFTSHGLKHWVEKYNQLSGVNFHLHRFRHTFACRLAKANADVTSIMNVLGHSSLRMTQRYLRSIKSEDARSYIDKLSF